MAHGKNAQYYNREYWSPRLPYASGWGRSYKNFTHRRERRKSREMERNAMFGREHEAG